MATAALMTAAIGTMAGGGLPLAGQPTAGARERDTDQIRADIGRSQRAARTAQRTAAPGPARRRSWSPGWAGFRRFPDRGRFR